MTPVFELKIISGAEGAMFLVSGSLSRRIYVVAYTSLARGEYRSSMILRELTRTFSTV